MSEPTSPHFKTSREVFECREGGVSAAIAMIAISTLNYRVWDKEKIHVNPRTLEADNDGLNWIINLVRQIIPSAKLSQDIRILVNFFKPFRVHKNSREEKKGGNSGKKF